MTVIAAGTLFFSGLQLIARQRRRTHHARKTTVRRRRHHYRRYHHYARLHVSPERVRQIQQALAKAGVFHQKPNGRWDVMTRDAMRKYQKENGFSPTGLPEAKPLMKLGLGPHPLPPGLEPLPSAEGQSEAEAGAGPTSLSAKKASTSNP